MRIKKLTLGTVAILAVLVTVATTGLFAAPKPVTVQAAGGDPIYMKYDGIDGEVSAVGHEGEIELLSWNWGMSRASGSGSPSLSEIVVTKTTDKSTPKLMEALARGEHSRRVELSLNTPGTRPAEYMKIILEDVMVSSLSLSGSSSDDMPTESLSLNFTKVKVDYQKLDDKGNAVGSPVSFSWDTVTNLPW